MGIPRPFVLVGVIAAALAVVPFAMIVIVRSRPASRPRIHVIRDMDNQPKFRAQAANPLFADGRAMRPLVAGTVARGRLDTDTHRVHGKIDDAWVDAFPMPVTRERLERGHGRFDVFCAACHGLSGYGDGPIHRRAETLEESRWIPPTTFHDDTIRNQPVGQPFDTITNGIRTMPAYGPQIAVDDRWAIVAYVRALQRSQHASLDDVPAEEREKLEP